MSMSMDDVFDMLHRKQAERLLAYLEDGDVPPPVFNAINRFLADNGITGVRGENEAVTKLSDGLDEYEQSMSDNVYAFKR